MTSIEEKFKLLDREQDLGDKVYLSNEQILLAGSGLFFDEHYWKLKEQNSGLGASREIMKFKDFVQNESFSAKYKTSDEQRQRMDEERNFENKLMNENIYFDEVERVLQYIDDNKAQLKRFAFSIEDEEIKTRVQLLVKIIFKLKDFFNEFKTINDVATAT